MPTLVLAHSRRLALSNIHRPRQFVVVSRNHGFSSTTHSSSLVQYALDTIQKLVQERRDKVDNPNRPQTSWERIRNFPEGVKALVRDCFRYKAIHDTPLNQWTIEYPTSPSTSSGLTSTTASTTTTVHLNRLPRRQYEQQRQLRDDFRTMFPLVLLWIPPIIGFIPPILAIVAPRQFMSRHFHNLYELEMFGQIEYQQRLQVYTRLGDMLWSSFDRSNRDVQYAMARSVSGENDGTEDEAGPPLDALTLYKTIFYHVDAPVVPRGMYLSIKDLPREYLVRRNMMRPIVSHSSR